MEDTTPCQALSIEQRGGRTCYPWTKILLELFIKLVRLQCLLAVQTFERVTSELFSNQLILRDEK